MAVEYLKILGQSSPTGGVLTTLYTVPSYTKTVISKIYVCNRGADATFRLSIANNAAADTGSQYLYWNVPLPSGETFHIPGGITIDAADLIRGYSSTSDVTFSIFGSEIYGT